MSEDHASDLSEGTDLDEESQNPLCCDAHSALSRALRLSESNDVEGYLAEAKARIKCAISSTARKCMLMEAVKLDARAPGIL